jgi:hypothetical protein
VDTVARRIVIDPPDGLIEANEVRLKPDAT